MPCCAALRCGTQILEVFKDSYAGCPDGDGSVWFYRWRIFYMACRCVPSAVLGHQSPKHAVREVPDKARAVAWVGTAEVHPAAKFKRVYGRDGAEPTAVCQCSRACPPRSMGTA